MEFKVKHLFFSVLVIVISSMACAWPPTALPTEPTAYAGIKKPPQITSSTPKVTYGLVEAEKGLRLRSVPDSAGPKDSETIVIMPNGSAFAVEKCEKYYGQWWAYGAYQDEDGKEWIGWARARYLKDGCNQ